MSKIENAIKLIDFVAKNYKNPYVMSSFGKDSIVLLDLIERAGYKFPIVFHREAFLQKKYEFANKVILDKDYTVYDYPPLTTFFVKSGKNKEIINLYQVRNAYTYLPTGLEDGNEVCGLEDIYKKPTGSFDFPWDIGFIGHKSSDIDPIFGNVTLNTDLAKNQACDFAFPLRYFTDQDIWDYIEQFNIPYNDKRYDKANDYKEFKDRTYNPDYFNCCTACMDADNSSMVYCYKINSMIPNISKDIRLEDPRKYLTSYVEA